MALIKHGNNALSSVTAFPSAVPTGQPVLLSTATASSSSSIEFTSGIDSTYDVYKFEFVNIHPSSNSVDFNFNMSTDGGSNYNVTKTSTFFAGSHNETSTNPALFYATANDLAQSTADQQLFYDIGNDNDQQASGTMFIFQPSSSVFVKHWICRGAGANAADYINDDFCAGYGNTTSPVNAIIFKFSSGNIDAGTIKMYGISA